VKRRDNLILKKQIATANLKLASQ